jgi:hypothetical protein
MLSSDLPGVNPATLNGMILYYRLMTKWSGLGDSTELSRWDCHRWYQSIRMHQSDWINTNHMIYNKTCQD